MSLSPRGLQLGRYVFGVASFVTGLSTLIWHGDSHHLHYIVLAAAAAQIFGGAALLLQWSAKTGAVVLCAAYLVFVLLCLPGIVSQPRIYNSWGNFFEQFSLLTGAVLVYASTSSIGSPQTIRRFGRIFFGLCTASFALEQAFYLASTASLVPKWIPPGQMFWAEATTAFFALAAVALLVNRIALLASRLLTTMLVIFGVVVWVPLVLSNPHTHRNWSEIAETFAIAGTAWILAELLGEYRKSKVSQEVRSAPSR
ncbi:MAG: hypothetical protein WBS24_13115 [Terriglobales bacterium]